MHTADPGRRRRISRRAFLATAGVATTAALIPRLSFSAGDPTVVIVGAGIAGLTCALELADLGISSTVYEASGRIGGRIVHEHGILERQSGPASDAASSSTGATPTIRRLGRRFALRLDNLLRAQSNRSDDIHFFGDYYPKSRADQRFLTVSDQIAPDAEAAGFPHHLRLQRGGGSGAE